jgi:hypothetical protein
LDNEGDILIGVCHQMSSSPMTAFPCVLIKNDQLDRLVDLQIPYRAAVVMWECRLAAQHTSGLFSRPQTQRLWIVSKEMNETKHTVEKSIKNIA